MTINALQSASIEDYTDLIAETLTGPDFREKLTTVHAKARRKIAFRIPEYVYTDEVKTPDGYPCAEVVFGSSRLDDSGKGWEQFTHTVTIYWTVSGDNPQEMGREIKRLVEATRDCFRDFASAPDLGGAIRTGDADLSPTAVARNAGTGAREFVRQASIDVVWTVIVQ